LSAQPAAFNSPEINAADHSVTFHLRAAKAQEVSVRGQWDKKPMAMTRSDEGVWSATASSVPAGVWEYSFIVDGLAMIDPSNSSLKPMRSPASSILHIPGSPLQPWDFQDVPHGEVHRHDFLGKAAGRPREVWVYTPPGYESDTSKKYPLLVLQHGSGDNQKTWVEHGKAHWILDNLIAQGKAKPMIVMMLDGHPLGQVPKDAADRKALSLNAFKSELLDEAMPLVESRYRVSADREQRAITGLSMGGWQSLSTGLPHLDRFAWIGSFSGAVDESEIKAALDDAAGTNAKLKLLWIAVGKDDFLRERNEKLVATLKASGIKHEWLLTEGDHSWPVWRGYLAQFVPLLFQR
jgi:enterochelin esterase family protein